MLVTPEKKKILIIDDDPATLDLLSFVFTQSGYQVVTGKNGREAVVLATREQPHLILLDYHMPLMNGFNAAGLIRRNQSTSTIPIIAITAFGTKELRTVAQTADCAEVFDKPLDPPRLLAAVKDLLSKSISSSQR